MTNHFRRTLIALLIAMTFALTLSAVALGLQPAALLQVRPTDYPTPVPTPEPTPGPTRGPAATPNPFATQAPGGTQSPRPNYQAHPYYPGIVKTGPLPGIWQPKPMISPIPQYPARGPIPQYPVKGIRTAPLRSAEAGTGQVNKMLQVNPTGLPTYVATPPPVYEPVKGYGLPYHPLSTPTPQPTGGYEPVQGLEVPYTPRSSPTPTPSGGASFSHEYGLPYHPVNTPTPVPTSLNLYRPGVGAGPFVSKPKPAITAIPQLPASRFRTRSG